MDRALAESVGESLHTPWILDCDTTVKPLYGHREGAEVSYNPHKPGCPSPVLHTDWIGTVRLVLDVEVRNGKAHAARHTLPRLCVLLEGLLRAHRPRLVGVDTGFGNEGVMTVALEALGQPYLLNEVAPEHGGQWADRAAVVAARLEDGGPGPFNSQLEVAAGSVGCLGICRPVSLSWVRHAEKRGARGHLFIATT
jgi:hypothetical protein